MLQQLKYSHDVENHQRIIMAEFTYRNNKFIWWRKPWGMLVNNDKSYIDILLFYIG